MAFGQEQIGLDQNIISACSDIVYIPQFGSVRSLNVACASAIAMYDYCAKLET
jgi:tRNA G18 (ribose-2'-O)-methylase SpoU